MTLKWDKFTAELSEGLPVDCAIWYDIFRENADQQQLGFNTTELVGAASLKQ